MTKNITVYLIILIILALVSGFFWSSRIWGDNETRGDDIIYKGVALDIVEKGQYTFQDGPTNVEPLYPFFLAGIFKIFGIDADHNVIRIIQIIIFFGSILLIFFISWQVTNFLVAYSSSIIAALCYALASPAAFLHRETLLIFLLLFSVYSLYRAQRKGLFFWYALGGVGMGLLMLTNTSFQFLPIFVILNLWFILRSRMSTKQILQRIFVTLVFTSLVIGPWMAYKTSGDNGVSIASRKGMLLLRKMETTELMFREPILNLVGFGLGYYIAEQFNPDIISKTLPQDNAVEDRERELISRGYTYAQTDKLFTDEAIQKIIRQPHVYAYAVLLNFIHLNNSFIPDKDDFMNSQTIFLFAEGRHAGLPNFLKILIVLGIRFVWLMFFAIIVYAIIKKYKNWDQWSWVILPVFYVNIIYSLIHGIPRFSLPIYPFYILLFVVGLHLSFKRKTI